MPPRARKAASLRVVAAGETSPPPSKPKTVTEAADTGTTRELLVAMRSRIAKAVEDPNTPARDLAALTKRLTEVVRDIEAIDAREDQGAERGGPVPDEAFSAAAL
jgi:ribosome-binding protein aMBF1 (putative translation factor)